VIFFHGRHWWRVDSFNAPPHLQLFRPTGYLSKKNGCKATTSLRVDLWVDLAMKTKKPIESWTLMLLLAEWTGLEPATPGVTGRYSNQLNYHSTYLLNRCKRHVPNFIIVIGYYLITTCHYRQFPAYHPPYNNQQHTSMRSPNWTILASLRMRMQSPALSQGNRKNLIQDRGVQRDRNLRLLR
jgi:hypothetical protein